MILHRNMNTEDMYIDTSSPMVDMNGMEIAVLLEETGGRMFVWMEMEYDRDDVEKQNPGLGSVWDESAAECNRFGVRSYDDLGELNRDLAAMCGDGETLFFRWDDLLECIVGV